MSDADAIFARFPGHETDPHVQDRLWAALADEVLSSPDVPFERHWSLWQAVFADRPKRAHPPLAWIPDDATKSGSNLADFMAGLGIKSYQELYRWSITHRAEYWKAAIERLALAYHESPRTTLATGSPPDDPTWLPGARYNIVEACFKAGGDDIAVIFGREGTGAVERWTYRELELVADRVSHGLDEMGLRPGDKVALYMPMTPTCVAAYLGIIQAGMVVVSIPDALAADEVRTRLDIAGADVVITQAATTRGGKPLALYPKVIEAGAKTCIVVADNRPSTLRRSDRWWTDFVGHGREHPWVGVGMRPDDVSNILFSSGTTGTPKAIPWTHLTPIKAAADGMLHQDIRRVDRVAWPTNIGWMMGPWLIYATLMNEATMILWEGSPTTKEYVKFLDRSKARIVGLVPSLARAWRDTGAAEPGSLPHVRVWSSTGEASNVRDYLWLMSLAGYKAPVIEYCGGTEIGGGHLTGTVLQGQSPAAFSTPALGSDVVVLTDSGQPAGVGKTGELFLRPPSIGLSQQLIGADHHETYYAGTPKDPKGSILRRHGDLVEVLGSGYFAARGRADDSMNLSGIKVASVELESVLNQHEHVVETAAVAVAPDGGGPETLVVFAVAPGASDPSRLKVELQGLVKDRMNPLFRIDDVVLVAELPRTPSQKIMRRALRSQYAPAA